MADFPAPPRRWLFTAAIFTGSFLLFLVQPMMARMALPHLGGAPNVWNSAMLVYQALLLGGYAYAHAVSHLPVRRQGFIHIALLLIAGLTLPLGLAEIGRPASGWEAVWVPWLFLLTVGPTFFAISAQAPLLQRWFAAHPDAPNPYPLFAASNLGSFSGLLAYPLVLEPLLGLSSQSGWWAAGYGLMVLLVAGVALNRGGQAEARQHTASRGQAGKPDLRRIALWLALAAVPSGLMLSTTTYLTTDIMAMPLLWVIPLGLYLLSFSIAFSARRGAAQFIVLIAPILLLVDGSVAMFTAGRADLVAAIASVVLLFVVSVALHTRLYEERPAPARLTGFYLAMAAGGALGGLFTAIIAPLVFDWMWEHPLLILAAAAFVPLGGWSRLLGRLAMSPGSARRALVLTLVLVLAGSSWLYSRSMDGASVGWLEMLMFLLMVALALLLAARRWTYILGFAALLLSLGGVSQFETTVEGLRERSYFGIYSVRDTEEGSRLLMHGTTIHGIQRLGAANGHEPTAYYGPTSGVGRVLRMAPQLFGSEARIGVVGLGVGTLACYREPGQDWTFFEIDPVVLDYSRRGLFTFLGDCAPDAGIRIGDARLAIEAMPHDSFDILAVDAFSSDAIPQHLLTREALQIYFDALPEDGLLLLHISNRYVALEPVLSQLAHDGGYAAALYSDVPAMPELTIYPSNWVAMARTPEQLQKLTGEQGWRELAEPKGATWTDEYASILPHLNWANFL